MQPNVVYRDEQCIESMRPVSELHNINHTAMEKLTVYRICCMFQGKGLDWLQSINEILVNENKQTEQKLTICGKYMDPKLYSCIASANLVTNSFL